MNAPKRSASPATTLVIGRLSCRISLFKRWGAEDFAADPKMGPESWSRRDDRPLAIGGPERRTGEQGNSSGCVRLSPAALFVLARPASAPCGRARCSRPSIGACQPLDRVLGAAVRRRCGPNREMRTMKRVVVDHYGGPEGLKVVDEADPRPGQGEVRVPGMRGGWAGS